MNNSQDTTDLAQYIKDAIRTESHLEVVHTDYDKLLQVMQMFIAAGNMLDAIKKNVFYGKPIDNNGWNSQLGTVINTHTALASTTNTSNVVDLPIDPRLFHALIGIATESTELIEAIVKAVENGTDIDQVNVREEMFDVMWYILIGHDALGKSLNETLDMGFEKLRHRYPDKFTVDSAIHRDVDKERSILESYE
jgi:NTP pyrophosphatase (non-canonical NTP hydrolase)